MIPDFVIDLGDYNPETGEQEYQVAETGEYMLEVSKEPEWGESKNKNPMFRWQFKIQSAEFPGVTVFENITFTEKSMNRAQRRVKEIMLALGFKPGEVFHPRNFPPVKGKYCLGDIVKQRATWMDRGADGEYPWENKVEKFKLYEEENTPEEVPF